MSLIDVKESSQSEFSQLEMILVKATDVYLHCESPSTSPEQLEFNIAHFFQVQRAKPAQAREGQSVSPPEVSVRVSGQPDHPLRRLVDFEVRAGAARSHIAIAYAPNPASISIVSAKDGRLIPTNQPNGLTRISDPLITRSQPAN
jgi:hypothetical protein